MRAKQNVFLHRAATIVCGRLAFYTVTRLYLTTIIFTYIATVTSGWQVEENA